MSEKINRFTSKALVDKIRDRNSLLAALPRAEAETAVNRVFDALAELLKEDDPVRIAGFGTFKRKFREGRTGRNPATGETVTIAAKHVVTFKSSKDA